MIDINIKELYDLYELEKKDLLKNKNNLNLLQEEFNKLDIKKIHILNKIFDLYNIIISLYKINKIDEIKLFLNKHKINYDIFIKSDNISDYLIDKKYKFIKYINSGFYGNVYLYKKNNKFYACKIETLNDNEEVDDFIKRKNKEYELSKIIGINHIGPKIYKNDYIVTDNKLYNILIMDYIEGDTLYNYLIEKKYSEDKINEIKIVINDKLNKLHKLNIFHRDLHLNNIMIVEKKNKFNIYFIDFGLSIKKNKISNNLSNKNLKVINYIDIMNKSKVNIQNIIIYNLYKNKKINFTF
jgi:tRNA A-37 threonylcarbamoyl transferase component Bud32